MHYSKALGLYVQTIHVLHTLQGSFSCFQHQNFITTTIPLTPPPPPPPSPFAYAPVRAHLKTWRIETVALTFRNRRRHQFPLPSTDDVELIDNVTFRRRRRDDVV